MMRSVTGPGRRFRGVDGEFVEEMEGIAASWDEALESLFSWDACSLSGIIRPMADGDSIVSLFLFGPWYKNISVASREAEIRLLERRPVFLFADFSDSGSVLLGKREYDERRWSIIDMAMLGSANYAYQNSWVITDRRGWNRKQNLKRMNASTWYYISKSKRQAELSDPPLAASAPSQLVPCWKNFFHISGPCSTSFARIRRLHEATQITRRHEDLISGRLIKWSAD